jgi:hypothetical protein
MMLVYRRAAILREWRAAFAWLSRACRADVPGIWSDTSHKMSFARQNCSLIGVPVWQYLERAVGFVRDDGHAKPRTRFLPLGGFFESCLVLCWRFAKVSQERCAHQATICSESGAADHQQGRAGAHVESFPMPQLDSASTVAGRATRPRAILHRPSERDMADVACFSSAVCIWRQYCVPQVATRAASRASPLIAACSSSSPLHRSLS